MVTKQEEILQVEEDAKNLVKNLKSLYEEVGSYKQAKEELNETNSNLLSFIDDTKKLSLESHKIIDTINKIGSGKIFEELNSLKKKNKNNFIFLIIGFSIILILQILNIIL